MSDIVLSRGVRNNLLNLQRTAELVGTTQNRLATGKKVNSALDNPTNFFTSASLQGRAADLSNLLDSMSQSIKTIETADIGIKGLTRLVEQMQANIRQARQDRSFRGVSYTLDPAAIGTASARNLTFSGGAVGASVSVALNTPDVGGTRTNVQTGANYVTPAAAVRASYTAQSAYAAPLATQSFTATFGSASVALSLSATDTDIATAVATLNGQIAADADANGVIEAYDNGGNLALRTVANADGAISVTGPDEAAVFGTQTSVTGSDGRYQMTIAGRAITINAGADQTSAISTINTALSGTGFTASASGGAIRIEANAMGATALPITGPDAGLFGAVTAGTAPTTPGSVRTVDQLVTAINGDPNLANRVRAANDNGLLRIENLSTQQLDVTGIAAGVVNGGTGPANATNLAGNEVRRTLELQFNELRLQFDRLAEDSVYNGINLLRGDELRVTFNEAATSVLSIRARDAQGNVRALNTSTLQITAVMTGEFSTEAALDTRLDGLSRALSELRSQSGAFGSNLSTAKMREDFTKSMIATLRNGADQLVLADQNEEAANLLSLQTRQQLSQTALSLANQADQGVLRLFG